MVINDDCYANANQGSRGKVTVKPVCVYANVVLLHL